MIIDKKCILTWRFWTLVGMLQPSTVVQKDEILVQDNSSIDTENFRTIFRHIKSWLWSNLISKVSLVHDLMIAWWFSGCGDAWSEEDAGLTQQGGHCTAEENQHTSEPERRILSLPASVRCCLLGCFQCLTGQLAISHGSPLSQETELDQKRADRHSLLKACKVE